MPPIAVGLPINLLADPAQSGVSPLPHFLSQFFFSQLLQRSTIPPLLPLVCGHLQCRQTAFYKSPAMTDLSRIQGPASAVIPTLEGRFYRPPLPDGYVLRPRLCERLSAGLEGRLLLVCAPAGFGKSSLAVEFCQSLPAHWQSLWLGLSPRDNDPWPFPRASARRLAAILPAIGGPILGPAENASASSTVCL